MKKLKQLSTIITGLTVFLGMGFVNQAHGMAVIYEPFSYNTGDLQGEGPATGTTGTWGGDNRIDVFSGSLSYGFLETSGNSVRHTGTGGGGANMGTAISSDLANAGLLDDSTTLWFSLLVNFADGPNDEMAFVLGTDQPFTDDILSSGSGVGIYVDAGSNARAAIYSGGPQPGTHTGTGNFNGTTQFIVGEINWGIDGSTADTVTLYAPGTDLDITGHQFSTVSLDVTQSSFDTLGIWVRNNDSDSFDEIRFGDTLANVTPIPEPSSFALILMATGGLFFLRRRRLG